MHTANPFIENYNFDALQLAHPELKKFVFINEFGTQTIKFEDKNAVKALNLALLKSHYNLQFWDIPKENLCPPIPGRLDYLLHINDLLEKPENVHILDIGTGANLIYPILATQHFNWTCTATEVDMDSLENAQTIIDKNDSLKSIELRRQKFKNAIFDHIIKPTDKFDVVICNPPFYKSQEDAKKQNQRKLKNLKLNPETKLNFGGISHELWCKGGEEVFVKRMINESFVYKNQVKWFTALVSQREHLKNIKRTINKHNPAEVIVTNMGQGNKVSRFIAWRF